MQQQGSTGTHFGANTTTTEPETLSTLTNATIKTGSNVLNLAHENATLKEQVSSLLSLIETLQDTVKQTDSKLETLMTNNNNNCNNRGGRNGMRSSGFNPNSKHYCWTHGLTYNGNHTSANCRNSAPGHQRDATFSNWKGGSNHLCNQAQNTTTDDPPSQT